MKYYTLKRLLSPVLILLIIACVADQPQLSESQKLEKFFSKQNVKILVTDSGLGGLSVAADLFQRLKKSGTFQNVDIIFFNAQPHIKSGYNSMKTEGQKVQVFENALAAMLQKWDPDMILIACNTLSVIYPETRYASRMSIPVVGIVEKGVDLIEENLSHKPDATVIIFATKTTVGQGTHRRMLLSRGISPEKIVTQACPKLAGSIERGTHSEETRQLVNAYTDSVMNNLKGDETDLLISYNCTHYGYVADLFRETFQDRSIPINKELDPNPFMADFIFKPDYLNRYSQPDINVEVYSQPKLPPKRIKSIAPLIDKISPQTAAALENYIFVPEFFEWESIAPLAKKK